MQIKLSKTTPKSTDANFMPKSVVSRIVAARRHVVLVCVWLFWLLLLGGAVLLAHLWTQRYDYLEQSAKQILAERNIMGDLDIIAINSSSLRIENIELREIDAPDETAFFTADIVEAHYAWQDLLKGKIDGLVVTRPKAVVEIDASGRIIAGWVPPTQTGDGSEFTFPKDGFTVKGGQLTVKSPYGEVSSSINAVVWDRSQFDVDLDITPAQLGHNDTSSVVGGRISVQAETEDYAVETDLNLITLMSDAVEAGRANIKSQLSVRQDAGQWEINGPMSIVLDDVVSGNTNFSNLSITSVGNISLPTLTGAKKSIMAELGYQLGYQGDVDITAQNLTAFDDPSRTALANKLSFHDILQKSPILRDFAPILKSQVRRVLSNTDIAAKLTITKQGETLRVVAREDVLISRDGTPWQIKPSASAPLIDIRPQGEGSVPYRGVSHFSFVKPAPLPVVLSQGSMQFGLTSPTAFAGVSAFDGRVHFPQNWVTDDLAGQPTSLLVQKADISFERAGETSQFAAKTDFNITGKIPGGYVTELGGSGNVVIDQNIKSSRLQFSSEESLSYSRVDLTSGWILEDGTLSLAAPVLMMGLPEQRKVDVALKDVTTRIHDGDVRDFQADIKAIDGTGLLQLKADGLSQDWALGVTDGQMTSAEFPIENTDIFTPKAVISTKLVEGSAPVFDIDSPVTSVSTDLVSTDEIAVHMSGTADNLIVDYDAKLFRFADPSLPQIPMVGQTRLIGTQWQGESVARLPQDLDTPIDVSFIFEDGEGEADVNIQTLSFTEKGLQPQNLVETLRGKIGAVNGSVSTAIKLEFGEGKDLKSYGTATFDDLDFGILPGTVQGLNGELAFTSFFPLETSGRQTLKLKSFDPGFPLPDGEIEFELLPGKINIHRAEWTIDDGSIYIEPLIWDFSATENRAVLAVKDVTIQNFIERPSDSKLEITGAVSGRLPLVVSGVQVNVEEGQLSVPNGGNIRFNHSSTDLAGAQNQAVGVAFDALKDFEYDMFELNINGPLDGLVRLRTVFTGANEDVYEGQPFEFDVEIEGELMNLMRNLDPERILSEGYYDLALKERAEQSHNHTKE
ncbi:MAG: YdbH domain-containing protein [Maricaulaceae bacterium]